MDGNETNRETDTMENNDAVDYEAMKAAEKAAKRAESRAGKGARMVDREKAIRETLTGLSWVRTVEIACGTYRASIVNVNGGTASWLEGAQRVVRAWRTGLFKGARYWVQGSQGRKETTLANVCSMFGVDAPKSARKAPQAPTVEAPAPAPQATQEAPQAPQTAPTVVPEPPQAPEVFTVGYDGGLTIEDVAQIMTDRKIDFLIDTRPKGVTPAPAWNAKIVSARFGARYVNNRFVTVETMPGARVLLLRKDEAPGDDPYALILAAKLVGQGAKVIHLYREEEVEAAELQRAIDEDRDYDCEIEVAEAADGADLDKVRARIAKLDRLASRNPNKNEAQSAAAEAARLRAKYGIKVAA